MVYLELQFAGSMVIAATLVTYTLIIEYLLSKCGKELI